MPSKEIIYSDKYTDDTHEYRHVTLPSVRPKKYLKYVTLNCCNAGSSQKNPEQQTDDGDRVEEARCPAESWLDPLHDPRA